MWYSNKHLTFDFVAKTLSLNTIPYLACTAWIFDAQLTKFKPAAVQSTDKSIWLRVIQYLQSFKEF